MTTPKAPTMKADLEQAEEVAAGLSEAQRRALLDAFDIGFNYLTTFASGRSAKSLHRKGLALLAWAPSGLTPLGLAVRAELLKGSR